MIVRTRPSLWELFGIWRLSVISRIAPQMGLVIAVAAAVVAAWRLWPRLFSNFSVAPFTLLGIALSIFLGFRNNACYDRWWEARRQLGALIGEVRSLARLTLALPCDPSTGNRPRRERAVRRIIAWEYALIAHLRGDPTSPHDDLNVAADLTPPPHLRDTPEWILSQLASDFSAMLADHEFGEPVYQIIDLRLTSMSLIQVACERIRSTPTPFAYTLLLHRTAYAFCLFLPFGLVSTMGYATPIFSALVAYAFFGLDALGDEMEEPFGDWPNALPLSAMARTMEISLLEALGDPNLPPPLQPVDHILR